MNYTTVQEWSFIIIAHKLRRIVILTFSKNGSFVKDLKKTDIFNFLKLIYFHLVR